MSREDLKDYPQFFKLAAKIRKNTKLKAEVRPFDVYQGPYIHVYDGKEHTVRIWGTEDEYLWFVEERTETQVGYIVPENKLFEVLREIFYGRTSKKQTIGYTEKRSKYLQ